MTKKQLEEQLEQVLYENNILGDAVLSAYKTADDFVSATYEFWGDRGEYTDNSIEMASIWFNLKNRYEEDRKRMEKQLVEQLAEFDEEIPF